MFERYTERARRVIFFARYEASQLGSAAIETEHLLLGLIREGKGLTSRRFSKSRGDCAKQRHALGGLGGRGRRRDCLFHRFAEPKRRKQLRGRRRRDVRHEAHIEAGLPRGDPQF